jgi:predicted Zn-ribbon and HTH transcriptional regulator
MSTSTKMLTGTEEIYKVHPSKSKEIYKHLKTINRNLNKADYNLVENNPMGW